MVPTVIILSFNSEDSIAATLESARLLGGELFLVDSGSKDRTVEIAAAAGAHVLSHPFENYGAQRNWAIDNVPAHSSWQLHLDADEIISPELRDEILKLPEDTPFSGFMIPRYLRFLGRLLRHNLAPTYHMRLFRSGSTRCEDRHYDQHFICTGPVTSLRGEMVDDLRMSLSEWTRRHNNWSDAEVKEITAKLSEGRIGGKLFGNKIQRKRYLRSLYDRIPLFIRPILLFIYRYFFRLGFLDGKEGLIFCVLQTLWFRFLVDAKYYEASTAPLIGSPSPSDRSRR